MHSEYYEYIEITNDYVRKRAVIDALYSITSNDLVDVLLEAVKAAHARFNVRKENFWEDLFLPTNRDPIKVERGRTCPHICPPDPYLELDSQAWLKYLLFGAQRMKDGERVTDSKSFFRYMKISFEDNAIKDKKFKDALSRMIGYRNTLFAHNNPAAFQNATFDEISKCFEDLCTLLRPMCVKEWTYQTKAVQTYNKLLSNYYAALGDTEYTVSKIMIHSGIPAADDASVKELLREAGLRVNGDSVTLSYNPTNFVDALAHVWTTGYSLERKAALLKTYLPIYEDEVVNALVKNTYEIENLSDIALDELVDEGDAKAQHEKASRLMKQTGDNVDERREEARRLFNAASDAGLPESQSMMAWYLMRENDPESVEKARELLAEASLKKDPQAYYLLGEAYLLGKSVEKNDEKAYGMFCESAKLGYGPAKADKARCELYGIGTEKNELAFDTLKALAKQEPVAGAYLGWYYYTAGDFAKAIEWGKIAAEQNQRLAQYMLGLCYYFGTGVTEDYNKAFELFSEAANKKHSGAQCMLGMCYLDGNGTEQDCKTAVELFEKSAEQGNMRGQYMLGWCYHQGNGVEKNHEVAFEWFEKAASQSFGEAQYRLGMCYLLGEGVEKDSKAAFEWFRKSEEQGSTSGQYRLGMCYYKGDGVAKNYDVAFDYFDKAASKNDRQAQYMLGICYCYGNGTAANYYKAVNIFSDLVEQNHAGAIYELARCYYIGCGVDTNYEKAFELFTKADELGNSQGTVGVGLCYYNARGVANDDIKAFDCFRRAAKNDNIKAHFMLGMCYSSGRAVVRNYVQAVWHLEKAAPSDKNAAELLIDIYTDKGKMYDEAKAVAWSNRTDAGHMKVAEMYVRKLNGVVYGESNLSYKTAMHWLEKAKAKGDADAESVIKSLKKGLKSTPFEIDINAFKNSPFDLSNLTKSGIKIVYPDE